MNANLAKATVVGALGGLLFGFDTAVISGTTHALTLLYGLTDWTLGVTVTMALAGTIIGAMSSGIPGQRWGGRETLRVLAVFYVLSALGCAFAWNWPSLLIARLIGGLGIGGSYFSNYIIARLGLGAAEWRWQFGVAAVPAVLFLVLLFGIPRSPRWLVTQNRVEEARSVLQMMGAEDPEGELKEIVESVHLDRLQTAEPLFAGKYRLPIFLAVTIGMFNQLSGINAILYYLNYIFEKAGYSKMSGDLQAVAVGAMNLVATLFAMTLIDKLGRKALLLIGSVGTAASLAGVSAVFFSQSHQSYLLWLLVAYIAFFAISQGAVIWVYIGEVFPNRVRAKGQGLGSSSHWIMNGLIQLTFPWLAKSSGAYPFLFFATMMLLQFFVVLFFYPETKGVTLEQMQHRLGIE